jgi:hypothetical protein
MDIRGGTLEDGIFPLPLRVTASAGTKGKA